MKEFFIKMLSSDGKISSKRFSAFFTLVNIIVLTYIATFLSKENQTPEFMFDALALIAGGGLGLTVIEKIFSKKEDKKQSPENEEPEQ
jgi:lipoprotein signal peptidase